jgi:hypothetical protein
MEHYQVAPNAMANQVTNDKQLLQWYTFVLT